MNRLTIFDPDEYPKWDEPPYDPLRRITEILILLIIWRLLGGC
jgi:hypothetical protein